MVAMLRHFNLSTSKVTFEKAINPLHAQRQDVIYSSQLIALDRAFTPATRREALAASSPATGEAPCDPSGAVMKEFMSNPDPQDQGDGIKTVVGVKNDC